MKKNSDDTVKRLCGMLGLAARARNLALGAELTVQNVRSGRTALALVACDASDNTKKRVFNCCKYYECECREIPVDSDALAKAVGHTGLLTAVAVTDVHMTKGFRKIFESSTAWDKASGGSQEV